MTIASRTPEGQPHQCPVCGEVAALEPSFPGGDACCPRCGQLLWWFRDHYDRFGFNSPKHVSLQLRLEEAIDSLDLVELIMELEEALEITIPEDEVWRLGTVEDVVCYLRERGLP